MTKRTLLIGLSALALIGLAGAFGLYTIWMGKPHPQGFRFPLTEIPEDQRAEFVRHCTGIALSEATLRKAVNANNLIAAYDVDNEDSATAQLKERAYVELTPNGKAMDFMVSGIRKEQETTRAAARTIYQTTMEQLIPKE